MPTYNEKIRAADGLGIALSQMGVDSAVALDIADIIKDGIKFRWAIKKGLLVAGQVEASANE